MRYLRFLEKENIEIYIEKYGPNCSGVFCIVSGYLFSENFNLHIDDLEKILNLVVTMTTVILGFIGVLLGIIATIKDKPGIRKFWLINHGLANNILKSYFMNSLNFGALLVICSIGLLIVLKTKMLNGYCLRIFEMIWCFLCGYSIASSYRVISFVMTVLFSESVMMEDMCESSMNQDEIRKLQKEFTKNDTNKSY